jgi:hypothetical protein
VQKQSLKVAVERRLISIVAIITGVLFTCSVALIISGYTLSARLITLAGFIAVGVGISSMTFQFVTFWIKQVQRE